MTTLDPARSRLSISAQMLARGLASHGRAVLRGSAERRVVSQCLATLTKNTLFLAAAGVGSTLDELVAREYRRVTPSAPIFVVAPARSGTTLLYNLLATDPQFVGPMLYEVMLPSVVALSAIDGLSARLSDARREAILAQIHGDLEASDAIHRVRLNELEEDGPYFEMRLASPYALRFFPYDPELTASSNLDELHPRARRKVMDGYYRMVQRVLHRGGPGRTYLAKAVCSAGRIGALLERFPDARLVHIVRHPYDVMPSALYMHWVMSHIGIDEDRRPTLSDSTFCRSHIDNMFYTYRTLLEWERRLPAERWLTLRFEQLVADPPAAVTRIYEHFGIPRSDDARQVQERACAQSRRHRARVRPPPLEQFGLTRADVYAALREVFEAYELDPRLDASAQPGPGAPSPT